MNKEQKHKRSNSCSSQDPCSSKAPTSSNATSFQMEDTRLIELGHRVQADADIWEQLEQASSKDDWAYGALLSVFGAEGKYYRARKPRSADKNLRLFPTQPSVLLVLKHHYRKWLRDHPITIDEECAKTKLPVDTEEDWPTIFEQEMTEDRDKRRKIMLMNLVKHLPGLLADKATNMYRQEKRSAGGDDKGSDEGGDSDEMLDVSSGGEESEVLNEDEMMIAADKDSSSNEFSPNSISFIRQQQNTSTP